MEINWKLNDLDARTIDAIVVRAWKQKSVKETYRTKQDLFMDITATHLNGNKLKLREMYRADDFNFFHDIWGIANNLNRESGQLENCFSPRFTAEAA